MVAINVFLVLGVLVTSWFAVQQSVDDSRGEENALTIAKDMLTAEQYAAECARLTCSARAARDSMSSAFFSTTRDDPPQSDGTMMNYEPPTYHNRHRSNATDLSMSEDSIPDSAGIGGVEAAT